MIGASFFLLLLMCWWKYRKCIERHDGRMQLNRDKELMMTDPLESSEWRRDAVLARLIRLVRLNQQQM